MTHAEGGARGVTDDLADFIDAHPMSTATWDTYGANSRAFWVAKSQGHIAVDPPRAIGAPPEKEQSFSSAAKIRT